MTEISVPETQEIQTQPKIAVIGVGGAGGNAIDNMIDIEIEGVNFFVANTDAQALQKSRANEKIQLGSKTTKGLGAGSKPDVGRASAEEAADKIKEKLSGLDMLFIAAGMGGGTGTGASPVIAKIAKEMDILTVAVVTKPFSFEGRPKMRRAEEGIKDLSQYVDTLLVIPNQNLLHMTTAQKNLSADAAFKIVDGVLSSGIKSITDLMVTPGLINLDFADIKTGMHEAGRAMMGTGEASEGKDGDTTAITAAKEALSNPLLDNTDIKDAKTVIVNVTCGPNLPLLELDEAVNFISEAANEDTNFMHGIRFDQSMDNSVRISIVATGISDNSATIPEPKKISDSVKIKKIIPHVGESINDAFTSSPIKDDEIITLKEVNPIEKNNEMPVERSSSINSMPSARSFFQSISVNSPEQQSMPFMTPEVIPLKNNEKIFKPHNAASIVSEENKNEDKNVTAQSFTLGDSDDITIDPKDKPTPIPSFFENFSLFRK